MSKFNQLEQDMADLMAAYNCSLDIRQQADTICVILVRQSAVLDIAVRTVNQGGIAACITALHDRIPTNPTTKGK